MTKRSSTQYLYKQVLNKHTMNEEAMKILSSIPMPEETKTPEVAPKENVPEPVEAQKVETEVQQTNSEVEKTPEEANPKKQKIGELVDLKRKARALSRELSEEKAEVEQAERQPEVDMEALKEQLLAEAEARLEAKFKPQLDEVETLRQENEKFKSEQAEVKLKSIINDEVKDFLKEYPQAELMIDKDYLVDLIKANPKNADMTGRDLILRAYPNATKSPRMDSYGQQGKNQPAAPNYAELDENTVSRIKKGGKAADDYVNFLRANR